MINLSTQPGRLTLAGLFRAYGYRFPFLAPCYTLRRMSISEIGTIFGISLAVASGAGSAGKLYLDTQYVSSDTIIELELRQLKRERRKLERLENPTPEQQWLIDDLNDEIEDLQRELDG